MAVLENGVYEAEDLFYDDGEFTVRVGAAKWSSSGNAFPPSQKTLEPTNSAKAGKHKKQADGIK